MTTHPLEMLSGEEIEPRRRDRARRPPLPRGRDVRPRRAARARQGRPGGRSHGDRAVEVQLVDGPGLGVDRDRRVAHRRRGPQLGRGRGRAPDAAVGRGDARDLHHQGAPRVHRRARAGAASPTSTTCRSTRGRPACSATTPRTAAASRAASRSCAPTRRTTATPGPIEGLIVHFDIGRNEVIEVIDHGVVAAAAERTRATSPSDNEPLRTDLKPISITQPEGPSFTVDGNLVHWQKWPFRIALRSVRGARAAPDHLRRRRARAPDPAPRVDLARWSSPTATRRACTAGRTRSTRASGASAA